MSLVRLVTLPLAAALLAVTAFARVGADEAPASPAARLAALAWLEGTWRGEVAGTPSTFETTYTSPEGGAILSVSKSLTGGRVDFHEFERIEVSGGDVVLQPYPMGRPAAAFTLSRVEGGAVPVAVFSNPANDFPRELHFERPTPDRLVILLAGEEQGRACRMTLDLRRAR